MATECGWAGASGAILDREHPVMAQNELKEYVCDPCGYVYDPEQGDSDNGVEPGTPFENLPDDWVCPVCGASKDSFSPEE